MSKGEGEQVVTDALHRRVTETSSGLERTFRVLEIGAGGEGGAAPAMNGLEGYKATFLSRPGDGLEVRGYTIGRFIQAVRKVIIRSRAIKRAGWVDPLTRALTGIDA